VGAQQRFAGDRAAKLPRPVHEHLSKRPRPRSRRRSVAGVCGDHEHDAAERSQPEPQHALRHIERSGRDAVRDHEDRADHEAGQATVGTERAQERGEPDQRKRSGDRRRHALLNGRRDRDRQTARERGAGAPADPLAHAAARDSEGGVETSEARGHADRRLAGRGAERERRAARDRTSEAGANVNAAPLDPERLRPHPARRCARRHRDLGSCPPRRLWPSGRERLTHCRARAPERRESRRRTSRTDCTRQLSPSPQVLPSRQEPRRAGHPVDGLPHAAFRTGLAAAAGRGGGSLAAGAAPGGHGEYGACRPLRPSCDRRTERMNRSSVPARSRADRVVDGV
jgi:hypothetical protein